jgi:hypothetical protein
LLRFAPVELGTRLAKWITMMLACAFSAASFAAGLVGPSLVLALAVAPQHNESDSSPASAIEQALTERACTGVVGEAAGYRVHAQCLAARLLTLRSDFGHDLNRLSPSERNTLDTGCSRLLTTHGREAYLDCLHAQLASLPARRGRTSLPVPEEKPVAAAAAVMPVDAATDTASPAVLSASFLSSFPLQSASALLITIAGSAAVVFFVKARRGRHACRVCAVRVQGPGDLCANCRHDAAETLRHAAADRAARKLALEDDKRREDEQQAEEQRQQKVRAEEEARRRQVEEARRCEHDARLREEDRQQREEFERQRQAEESQLTQAAASDDAAFDPFAVLGVARGASDEAIRTAFEIARLTYDPEEVSHLGADAQGHFAAKLRMAERAYQMLGQ